MLPKRRRTGERRRLGKSPCEYSNGQIHIYIFQNFFIRLQILIMKRVLAKILKKLLIVGI